MYQDNSEDSEGVLSKKRSKIISNSFLKKCCIKTDIYKYILLNHATFLPPGLEVKTEEISTNDYDEKTKDEDNKTKELCHIPNKIMADVIESLLAVI